MSNNKHKNLYKILITILFTILVLFIATIVVITITNKNSKSFDSVPSLNINYYRGAVIDGKQFKDFDSYLYYLDGKGALNGTEDGSIAFREIFDTSLLNKYKNNTDYMSKLKKENPKYKEYDKEQIDDILYNLEFQDAYISFLNDLNPISKKDLDNMKVSKDNFYVAYVSVTDKEFKIYDEVSKKGKVSLLEDYGFTFKNINELANDKNMYNMFKLLSSSDEKINYMKNEKDKYIIVTLDKNKVSDELLKLKILETKFRTSFVDNGYESDNLFNLLLVAHKNNKNFALSEDFTENLYNKFMEDREITVPYLHLPSQYFDNLLRNKME